MYSFPGLEAGATLLFEHSDTEQTVANKKEKEKNTNLTSP